MQAAPFVATASVLALTLGAAPRTFAGEKVRAELHYVRGDDACPDEPTMRGLVASRLGYDPFVERADLALSIEFRRQGGGQVGRVALSSKDVAKGGTRVLRSSDGDCSELASSVALAVALAIDPSAARAEPAPPEPPPAPALPPAQPPVPIIVSTPTPAPTTSPTWRSKSTRGAGSSWRR